jgi:hypothetical protein
VAVDASSSKGDSSFVADLRVPAEMRAMSREGRAPRLVEPDEMVPPLL